MVVVVVVGGDLVFEFWPSDPARYLYKCEAIQYVFQTPVISGIVLN